MTAAQRQQRLDAMIAAATNRVMVPGTTPAQAHATITVLARWAYLDGTLATMDVLSKKPKVAA